MIKWEINERNQFEEKQRIEKNNFSNQQKKRRNKLNNIIMKFENDYDPYEILGVKKNTTLDKIKKNYKKLALQFHPDRNNGKTEGEFQIITQAYCYLLNKKNEENKYENKINQDVTFQKYKDNINEKKFNIHLDKENFDIKNFNKIFDSYKIEDSFDKGYGSKMAEKNTIREDISVKNDFVFGTKFNKDIFNSTFQNDKLKKSKNQIIEYKEPEALCLNNSIGYSDLDNSNMKDFGIKNNGLGYTDYMRAHTTDNTFINPDQVEYKKYNSLNHLKADRENINYNLSEKDKKLLKIRKEQEMQEENRRLQRIRQKDELIRGQYNNINRLLINK